MKVARKTKAQGEEEVLTKKTRKNVAAARAVDVSVVEEEVPRIPRKPKKAKRKTHEHKETLEELSNRYSGLMQMVFSELNTDRNFDGFEVTGTCALDETTPGIVWMFANLTKSGVKLFNVASPICDYPEDVRNIAGLLFIEMCLRGQRIAEWKGV